MADSAQPQDSSVLPSWVHLDSNSWDILDAIFSSVTATVVCVFMTALFVHLSGYSRLWRDSGLHWSERARRLLPLRSVILLTVSLAIFLQPIECYFFLRDGVDIDWLPTIVVILWIVSYIAYILIYTFSNLGSISRTWKNGVLNFGGILLNAKVR